MDDQWHGQTQAISERDAVMMQLAITQAKMAEQAGEVPVGAVLAREDEVLEVGYNPTLVRAILRPCRDVALRNLAYGAKLPPAGTTLYVTSSPVPCVRVH